jgi:hypothetical protein
MDYKKGVHMKNDERGRGHQVYAGQKRIYQISMWGQTDDFAPLARLAARQYMHLCARQGCDKYRTEAYLFIQLPEATHCKALQDQT